MIIKNPGTLYKRCGKNHIVKLLVAEDLCIHVYVEILDKFGSFFDYRNEFYYESLETVVNT